MTTRANSKRNGSLAAIKPVPHKEYDLAGLLKRITPENLHEEVDFGRPVGKEEEKERV